MNSFGRVIILLSFGLLSACSGLTQMQDTLTKFDQGAHQVNTAEISLFRQLQTAECNRLFYNQAFDFTTAASNIIDIKQVCTSNDYKDMTDERLNIRKKLMDTITLYADALQSLANGTDNKNLNDNSVKLVKDVQSIANNNKFIPSTVLGTNVQQDATILNTALVTITNMILDHKKYADIKEAASEMNAPLAVVVNELKNENMADTAKLTSEATLLAAQYVTALKKAREINGVASFIDVVNARNTYQSIVVSTPNLTQLNAALDALLVANQALSRTTNGGAIPEISDLISRGQQAATLYNSTKN
jgi:hypothetical protein